MSTAILRIYAPLSDDLTRQTFREAGVESMSVGGDRRWLKPVELDCEWIEVTIPACEEGCSHEREYGRC